MNRIEEFYPRLRASRYNITSEETTEYNCIAFAAGDEDAWWWPDVDQQYFWPEDVPRERSLAAFVQVFSHLGYESCESKEPETGIEKIAIFANAQEEPTHAARQVASGLWKSKLGNWEDIEHKLHDVEGESYGTVVLIMKRPIRD